MHTVFLGAAGTAEDQARHFHSVTDHAAATVLTGWRQCVNRAFEAIEDVRDMIAPDFEAFVVIVSADFTERHTYPGLRFGSIVYPRRVLLLHARVDSLNILPWRFSAGRILAFRA